MPKIIWALLDERQGNTSQTLGVADALGIPYVTKNIRFNNWIKIPNYFLNTSLRGIREDTRSELTSPWPDLVISTARRLGIVASYIKFRNPATFLAQVQWPGIPSTQFDLIAAPLHDGVDKHSNVISTLGAPHRVTEAMLKTESQHWVQRLSSLPSPRIALLIGGSSRGKAFSVQHAEQLARLASGLAGDTGGSLMITTSRRTSLETTSILKSRIRAPHFLHAWGDDTHGGNPYYGFLGLADAIIATGDSISMCSEACATGKPVFIYTSDDFVSAKHQQFVHAVFKQKLAQPLSKFSMLNFSPSYRLDESGLIADEILRRLNQSNNSYI